jgi:hypothetical protein
MSLREEGALFLALMTSCSSVPRALPQAADPYEAQLAAERYELHVVTEATGQQEPVQVSAEDFRHALRKMAPQLNPSEDPRQQAQWLMEGGLEADLLAEVQRGRVVRLTPLDDGGPLEAASAAQMKRTYLAWCQREYGGGDCLGLLTDGPILQREDLRTLALAMSFKGVLKETGHSLKQMMSPQALVAMIAWTGCFYLLLWLLPEPTSKLLAASLTLALLAWLPVHTLWSLMDGWAQLVHEVDRATSWEQMEQASERFSRVMGENTARVVVMLVTAALTGSAAQFAAKLPTLPGFARAAAQAEAQGVSLAEAAEVEAVSAAEEGTFTLMVRRPGGRATATVEATEAAEAQATTIIRHQGGNRQVVLNGQRWHVPASKSIREIPSKDSVGDQLQAAAQRAASRWSRSELREAELAAINKARAQGNYLKARIIERMARGKFVERALRQQFERLEWSPRGVDAIDPATGLRYEVLSGTVSNMELHGRRMAEEFFRLITF